MLAMWVKVRVKAEERERFSRRSRRMLWAPNGMSQVAFASTYCETSRTRMSITSSRFTGAKPRWKRTGQRRTLQFGARLQTLSTAHPRRRVAILCFLLTSSIGKNAGSRGEHFVE
jgi:hypothetical protein